MLSGIEDALEKYLAYFSYDVLDSIIYGCTIQDGKFVSIIDLIDKIKSKKLSDFFAQLEEQRKKEKLEKDRAEYERLKALFEK